MEILEEKVSRLEEMMMRLLYLHQKGEIEAQKMKEETEQEKREIYKKMLELQYQVKQSSQETDRKIKEAVDYVAHLIEQSSQEFRRDLKQMAEEFDRKMQEQRQQFLEEIKLSREEFDRKLQKDREEFDRKMQEQRQQFLEEIRLSREEFDRKMQEQRQQFLEEIRLSREEFDRKMQEQRQQFLEEIRLSREEFDRKLEEQKQRFDEELEKRHKKWEKEFKEEVRNMNKRWGEISNKLGTIVEDIIFPATEPVLSSYFKCDIHDLQLNRKKKKNGLKDEFDVIAVSESCKTVFLIEVKATPKIEYINEFKDKKVERFKTLFPEYSHYKLVLVFASLRLEDDIVNYLTKHGIYAMAYREWEYMDILNFEEINKSGGQI